MSLHARARAGVARTWQHMRLFGSLSVLENLLVAPTDYLGEPLWRILTAGGALRRDEQQARVRAMHILQRVHLSGLAGTKVIDITFGPDLTRKQCNYSH